EKEAEKEAKALATADATSVAPDGDQATKILAVTACPTGIAHTYMAAESLEKAADKAGVDLKVETNGSGGVKGRLTDAEIAEASAIIVAADKDVELARFDGKKVIMVKVADGIHKADELIRQAEDGDAPIYKADPNAQKSSMTGGDSAGRKIYKSLMNGVSHMLPFVIGGGILIAIAFLLDGANAGTEIFGVGNPASNFLKTVGGLAFGVMFPILAGYIAMAIGERPALMPGMVGGYLASSGFAMHFDGMPYEGGAVSGFFGALIAGFLAGYLVVGLRKLFDGLPRSLEGIKPILLYPVCSIAIIGLVMVFIVNPPMAVFNSALFDALGNLGEGSKLIFGLVLGGMMSIDFGGPINKAAYVFGTASVASGQPEIMAAVMIGGMVPPIAIAIATLVFKNKFTKAERQTTASNFVMGLSFITEGAIPFAASDPIRVIPSCAVGAAIAGGLSMIFNCSTPAPHGGIFVIALVEHPIQYVIALIIGSVISAVLLGTLKKKIVDE
ncbi:MAG: PTS fructose transporter subunit IIBC, partial [Clostridiales Family XIII bacterium]|nr:PTS fructose transporter subunit IIBC [Clostridiales Family XIII bacterium]